MNFAIDELNAENLIYILIIIIFYVMSQKITIKEIKTIFESKDKHFKDNFKYSLESSKIINGILDKLLYDLNADRIYIFQYHNGGSNIEGIPFARCSNTHERCEVGVTPHIQNYQNLPLAMYGFRTDLIIKGDIIEVHDLSTLKDTDKSAYNLLKSQNIKSLYVAGLYNDQCRPIGFLGVDYIRNETTLNKDDINLLVTMSSIISQCLSKTGAYNE